MPVVSITRLRVRSWRYLPSFFIRTLLIARQAGRSAGNLAVVLLRDSHNTFWTGTIWSDETAIKTFMHAAPHGPAMHKLLEWCDEASLVRWTQDSPELPSWDVAHRRLEQEGRASKVNYPSPSHIAHKFPAPTTRRTAQLRIK
jgi:hypothetical protein